MSMTNWLIDLRIWWWKKLYSWRVWEKTMGPEGQSMGRQFADDTAEIGWQENLRNHDGNVIAALQVDPSDEADEEMSNWTNDEEPA